MGHGSPGVLGEDYINEGGICCNDTCHVLKVSSYNLHSRHVIEKMGAELVCQEETLLQKAARIAKEQSEINKVRKGCQMDYGLNLEEQEEVVYRYHLLPNVFLK